MKDDSCVGLLQWALPRLRMRWQGFHRVRHQVCKRLSRRLAELGLGNTEAYQAYLEAHTDEWAVLDTLCRVTVTRFYRDRQVFAALTDRVLPGLAEAARERHRDLLRVWCAGCASGEEPYSLAIVWWLALAQRFPGLTLKILGSDTDPRLLARAEIACYSWGSVRNLPAPLLDAAFERDEDRYCLNRELKAAVHWVQDDLRAPSVAGPFDLICCRNLAFTYFDQALQSKVAQLLYDRLSPGGVLLLGVREHLPPEAPAMETLSERLALYRKPLQQVSAPSP